MRKYTVPFLVLLFLGIGEGSRWSSTGNVYTERSGFENTMFTNGKIIIMGGLYFPDPSTYRPLDTYEFFDPATGEWTQGIGTLPDSSDHSMSALLPNGKIFYMDKRGKGWLYDPFTNNWSPGVDFGISGDTPPRIPWTLLKNRQLLIMGYDPNDDTKCALYDYSTNTFSITGALNVRHFKGAVECLFPDGKVLITRGYETFQGKKAEIYDPNSGTWTLTGEMNVGRARFAGTLLRPPWGQFLVVGKYGWENRTELYNLGTWTFTDDVHHGERETPAMILLPVGQVLLAGGANPSSSSPAIINRCELYDHSSGQWLDTTRMINSRAHCGNAILYTGKALVISGQDSVWYVGNQYYYRTTARCEIFDPSQPFWTGMTNLNQARSAHTVTPLPIHHTINCSTTVLIAGGEDAGNALKSCELFNYSENTCTFTGDLNVSRAHHTAVLLPSGKVLAVGGKNPTPLKSCELYDMTTETWAFTGEMSSERFGHTATLLKDGRVLVTGGENSGGYMGGCELYNNNSWSTAINMITPRARHSAVLLLDGRVLVIGGETASGVTNLCEIWDGTSWSSVAPLSTARCLHTSLLLQSGKVLVIGGKGSAGALTSCEIYDPSSNSWAQEANLNYARYLHNSTLLYSGLVLTTAGYNGSSYIPTCEIWDPAAEWDSTTNTHKWKVVPPINAARGYHASVLIPSIRPFIFSIGGKNSGGELNSIQRFDIGLGYVSWWQSTITNHKSITHISSPMYIEGTLFRDYSEADGGNHAHAVSSDHPIMSLVRVGSGNWQANGGGDIMYMPLSSSWDETHTDIHPPTDFAQGYYRIWSIVNGIPCKWYETCVDAEEDEEIIHGLPIQVFPNPSTGTVNIQFKMQDVGTKVVLSIYDCTGRLVRNQKSEIRSQRSETIRLDSLKPGIYFYSVKHKDLEVKGKFVIL